MPFVLLVPLVAVVAALAVALGVPGRQVLTWSGAAVGVLVLLTAASVVVIALVEDDDGATDGRAGSVRVRRVDAVLEPPADDPFPEPTEAIAGLADGDTLLVRVPHRRGQTVHQCPADRVQPVSCSAGIPAVADPSARRGPTVLVEVTEALVVAGRRVDCVEQACALAAFGPDGRPTAVRPITFGEATPRPQLLAPTGPVSPGEVVTVRLRGLPPGGRGVVTLCAPGRTDGAPACGSPAPEVPFQADASGAATARLPIEVGPVGRGAGRCERRSPCAVGVIGAPVATGYAPLRFAGPPGPDIPAERAGAGLAAAALLVAAAVLVVRRTDWTPPGGDPFADVSLGGDPFAGVDLDDETAW